MFQNVKKRLKNQRGLTLVELLAVIVILGIVSAIAIPSIGGLIDNSKKDAHVANATQLINSAKLWAAGNEIPSTGTVVLSLQDFYDKNLIDNPLSDPDGVGYEEGTATDSTGSDTSESHVVISRDAADKTKLIYTVTLTNGERGIKGTLEQLKRDAVDDSIK